MTVKELNSDQLSQLKWNHFYREDKPQNEEYLYDYPHEIPDDVIFDYYGGTYFVEEDFNCNT